MMADLHDDGLDEDVPTPVAPRFGYVVGDVLRAVVLGAIITGAAYVGASALFDWLASR
jgi:hypothetical protein